MLNSKLSKLLIVLLVVTSVLLAYKIYLKRSFKTEVPYRIYTNEKVTEKENGLVAGFPNISQYPDAKIKTSYKKVQDNKTDYVAVWEIKGANKSIMDWYKSELTNSGWTVTGIFSYEQDSDQMEVENEEYKLKVALSEDNDDAKILITEFLEK